MWESIRNLDRRWIFLAMAITVAVPILLQQTFPEAATDIVKQAFSAVEELPSGSSILLPFDYDPSGAGELTPMATAFVRHCAAKGHKMYFLSLWPLGGQMIDEQIRNVIHSDFPDLEYGEDYVNLGYKEGREAVIRVVATNLKEKFPTDNRGINLNEIPMTQDIESVQEMDLILNICAGDPGTKEWVQYVGTPYRVPIVTGCTGVQYPLFLPYYPDPIVGMLPAIKGAAEYEELLGEKYPRYSDPQFKEGYRRMPPQMAAHLLIVGLIILGNIIFFVDRRRGVRG